VFQTVHCDKHGDRRQAFVCNHLVHGTRQGFFTASGDATNPYPDAWCSNCQQIRLAHGGEWNAQSEALIDVRLVCGGCYDEIKQRNALATGSTSSSSDRNNFSDLLRGRASFTKSTKPSSDKRNFADLLRGRAWTFWVFVIILVALNIWFDCYHPLGFFVDIIVVFVVASRYFESG
jgi:hypothetical protein